MSPKAQFTQLLRPSTKSTPTEPRVQSNGIFSNMWIGVFRPEISSSVCPYELVRVDSAAWLRQSPSREPFQSEYMNRQYTRPSTGPFLN